MGELTSVPSVSLSSNALVDGDLTTEGTLSLQQGATIAGTIEEEADIAEPEVLSWQQPVAENPNNPRTVFPEQSTTLSPGGYGKLTVYSRGTLHLQPGTYAFSDLQLEPDSTIQITSSEDDPTTDDPTTIYTSHVTAFRGDITTDGWPGGERLLFVSTGSDPIRLESSASMAIVAPHARVEFATGGASYSGSVYAQGIYLEPDVTWTYLPFEHWESVLPIDPFVSCVMGAGPERYMAAFGYENSRDVTVELLPGSQNTFDPESSSLEVPHQFLSGRHDEAVWVNMTSAGVTWQVNGLSATATLDAPPCQLPAPDGDSEANPRTESRSFPSPSLPNAPSPRSGPSARNMVGPGRFITPALPAGTAALGISGPTGNVPSDPSDPPNVPRGLELFDQTTELEVEVNAHSDGVGERVLIDVEAFIQGDNLGEEWVVEADETCAPGACAPPGPGVYHRTHTMTASDTTHLAFYAQEHNEFSNTEAILVDITLDRDTLTWSGYAKSGPANTHDFGNFIHIETAIIISGTAGAPTTVIDYAGNQYTITISTPTIPLPQDETRICPDWTAYFVDTEVPGAPVAEPFPGQDFAAAFDPNPMPEDVVRLRGHPAAFASVDLRVRGPFASYSLKGKLDEEGCLEVPSIALLHMDGFAPGSPNGGIAFWMEVSAYNSILLGRVDVPIQWETGDVVKTQVGFNAFDDGPEAFPLVGDFRVPPARVDIAGRSWNHGTTVAAAVARSLKFLSQDDVAVTPNTYPVVVGEGVEVGTVDHLCRAVPDSYASDGNLFIGPGFFPCAQETPDRCQRCNEDDECPSGICDEGACVVPEETPECRQECSSGADCPGGQHCATASDHGQACNGSEPCFCAWPGQGSMKTVVAHEFGHVIQEAMLGGIPTGGYRFSCPTGQNCTDFGRLDHWGYDLVDPPGMAPICGCQHVTAANALHCLQSAERTSAAQSEGFAQFFAARTWNKKQGDCLFYYYKEFIDDECHADPAACRDFTTAEGDVLTLTEVPVPINCGTRTDGLGPRWRNTNNCAVPAGDADDHAQSEMGTEYDWMTFLRALDASGLPLNDVMNAFRHACQPENNPVDDAGNPRPNCDSGENPADGCYDYDLMCDEDSGYLSEPTGNGNQYPVTGRQVYWLDREEDGQWDGAPLYDRGGLLDGARRAWGLDDPRTNSIAEQGFQHGVDENVAP